MEIEDIEFDDIPPVPSDFLPFAILEQYTQLSDFLLNYLDVFDEPEFVRTREVIRALIKFWNELFGLTSWLIEPISNPDGIKPHPDFVQQLITFRIEVHTLLKVLSKTNPKKSKGALN